MRVLSFLSFILPLVSLSIAAPQAQDPQKQIASVNKVLSDLSPKINNITTRIIIARAQNHESSTDIGDLINQIDNLLTRATSVLQNLPTRRRSITFEKRQDASDVQVLEERIIADIVHAISGLDVEEVPTLPKLLSSLDTVLAFEIRLVSSRIGDDTLLKKLAVPLNGDLVDLGLDSVRAALT